VIFSTHPVRAALSLIASFFGVAVLFVLQEAHFLALVQVVVYAGAIVVLFLFVIMLLGVDQAEDIQFEPLAGQRAMALLLGGLTLLFILGGLFLSGPGGEDGAVALTGRESVTGSIELPEGEELADVDLLADDLFGRNLLAFEATALLLTIATIGAVVLVRNRGAEDLVVDEPGTAADNRSEQSG
jgi:NADH-quinone oxidoreductase subunit J